MTQKWKSRMDSALEFLGLRGMRLSAYEQDVLPGKHRDKSGEFYLKEFECLRREIELVIQFARTLERNVVVAIGISWAWLFHERDAVPRWSWLIPCFFAFLGAIRAFGNFRYFMSTAHYLKKVELTFSDGSDPGGWHRFAPRSWTRASVLAFWALLIFATIGVTVYELGRR
jgi:hypothetical protein